VKQRLALGFKRFVSLSGPSPFSFGAILLPGREYRTNHARQSTNGSTEQPCYRGVYVVSQETSVTPVTSQARVTTAWKCDVHGAA
jgi:hypothetical protein